MRSSFHELMGLVARDLERRDAAALKALHAQLHGLRRVFQSDRDLLEAVIRRVERARGLRRS